MKRNICSAVWNMHLIGGIRIATREAERRCHVAVRAWEVDGDGYGRWRANFCNHLRAKL